MVEEKTPVQPETCPKCGSPLTDIVTTASGRQLRRCTQGKWNPDTRQTEGCDYVQWLEVPPEILDEKCPKCGANLVLAVTKYGKKLKKCSTNSWDKEKRVAVGCDYVEWLTGTTQQINEACPVCGAQLVIFTTSKGKKLKKCSTSGWDKERRVATGCSFIEWL